MKRIIFVCILVWGLVLSGHMVSAEDFYVVPVKGAYAPVEKTGQTTSYATGDDGDLQKGVSWPNPRFTDNGDGTAKDNLTGLIWLKNYIQNCPGFADWNTAISFCNGLAAGACSLTDGSVAGDWRLPNVRELQSLIDYGRNSPALPSGHPFTYVEVVLHWSSTTYNVDTGKAWTVDFSDGSQVSDNKTSSNAVLCVRDRL